jgi:HTH-type transcriptional regulator/antitoxin HigA
MESIGSLVETYENNNFPEIYGTAEEALRYLMNEHDVKQSDLSEIGGEKEVSEILKGERSLTVRQIKALSARFNVSPLVFIQEQ